VRTQSKSSSAPARKTSKRLSQQQLNAKLISTMHAALAEAGLTGVKISSMHLSPMDDPDGAPGTCHAVKLPNGEIHIVCV
jgi:hypothetical protein